MNMSVNLIYSGAFMMLSVALYISGCADNTVNTENTDLTFPESEVSFSRHIQPILNNHCAPCHINRIRNGVMLNSYKNVINSVGVVYRRQMVDPGNPDNSPLLDIIKPEPEEFPRRAPLGGPFLSDEEIQVIRMWIEEGAKDN